MLTLNDEIRGFIILTKYNLLCSVAFLFAGFVDFPADWSIIYMWIGAIGVIAYYEQTKREELK